MSEEEYQRSWIEAELEETLDDLFEAEFNQPILTEELRKIYKDKHPDMLDRRTYYSNLLRLQSELVKTSRLGGTYEIQSVDHLRRPR